MDADLARVSNLASPLRLTPNYRLLSDFGDVERR